VLPDSSFPRSICGGSLTSRTILNPGQRGRIWAVKKFRVLAYETTQSTDPLSGCMIVHSEGVLGVYPKFCSTSGPSTAKRGAGSTVLTTWVGFA